MVEGQEEKGDVMVDGQEETGEVMMAVGQDEDRWVLTTPEWVVPLERMVVAPSAGHPDEAKG